MNPFRLVSPTGARERRNSFCFPNILSSTAWRTLNAVGESGVKTEHENQDHEEQLHDSGG
jgi:hypothetical protein